MKLLIITQVVDSTDPVLGFFIRWIEELSKNTEHTEVICLKDGKHNFSENIRIHSLGKPASHFRYILNFYKLIFSLDYDIVFVHMNQEYMLLGGIFWRFLGNKSYLWRNHSKGSFFTRMAILLANKVFYTSQQSFTARFKKAIQMPVGIDTDFFKPDASITKKPNSILFLGRIAPVKNVEVFVDAINELNKLGVEFSVTIAGSSLPKDAEYEKLIHRKVSEYCLDGKVEFVGSVTQDQALELYRKHELYINLTPSGSLDKTIFEAMSCEVIPLVYNDGLIGILGEEYIIKKLNARCISEDIKRVFSIEQKKFRNYVVENHDIKLLSEKFFNKQK